VRLTRRTWVIFGLVVLLLGAAALVVSFALTPTPDSFTHTHGHRVRVPADMHAVDYAILLLRIGGALALLGGAYVASRPRRPRSSPAGDDPPPYEPGDPAGWAADTTRSRASRRF
jgi:hypothetical protein